MNHFFYTAYNSIPDTFYVLLVLIVIDYITGVCLALKRENHIQQNWRKRHCIKGADCLHGST